MAGIQSIEGLVRQTSEGSHAPKQTLLRIQQSLSGAKEASNDSTQSHVPSTATTEIFSIDLDVMRSGCGLECDCICHGQSDLSSSNSYCAIIGYIFIGYRSSPKSAQRCSDLHCQSRYGKLTYTFPRWLCARAAHASVRENQPEGPELNLRMLNIRPPESPTFRLAP